MTQNFDPNQFVSLADTALISIQGDISPTDFIVYEKPIFSGGGRFSKSKFQGRQREAIFIIGDAYDRDTVHKIKVMVLDDNNEKVGRVSWRKISYLYDADANARRAMWNNEAKRNALLADKHSRGSENKKTRQQAQTL